MKKKELAERTNEIINAIKGKTISFNQIAKKFGLTRQRISQIFFKHFTPEERNDISLFMSQIRKKRVAKCFVCFNCGSNFKSLTEKRVFCSFVCMQDYYKKNHLEWLKRLKEYRKKYQREYYKKNREKIRAEARLKYLSKKNKSIKHQDE